ncbi:MAG: DUF167 domain-containing protein [bacterium]
MTWIKSTPDGVVLTIRVVPRASKNSVDGPLGDALKIRLQSPPVDGKANKALVRFLADMLDIAASRVVIVAGETGRSKRILVRGMDASALVSVLDPR